MIVASTLEDVLSQVANQPGAPGEVLVGHLRNTFPDVHFTVCSDDDIPPRLPPAADNDICRLYFVAKSEHCLTLTTDAEAATGLVVALCDGND